MNIGSKDWNDLIIDSCREFGADISPEQCGLLARHAEELLRWNRKVNLTAITEPQEVAVKHYIDSLIALPFIPAGAKVLDMGTGGGFPGLPLKIAVPSLSLTLLDSVRKKISFLQFVIRSLQLKEAEAIHSRAEELALKPGYRGEFDIVICRALTDLGVFADMALPFLKSGGKQIALKGKITEEEMAPVRLRMHTDVEKYVLPVFKAERTVLIMKAKERIGE
ncbi:MAG: 16S rRNA (guanine(527)-N(7))-methyltransferase RsmG [Desulfococcaceae bacterium]|jgi:16S rRNA (guanine527-N7)-methyltransferase|nr:16S rRNA (guanine(527)-N(7))-methyltransferase RsmG [Desulfococcaceae bacterium]